MNNRKFVLSLGVFATILALGGVMVWTVARVQNPQNTIGRPKAVDCSLCNYAIPGSAACEIDCKGCPKCSTASNSGSGGAPRIEGCKYKSDTPDAKKCGENSASGQSVAVTDSSGVPIKYADSLGSKNMFGTGPDTNIGTDRSYTVTVDNFPGYYYWPWRANICVGKYICFSGGATYCTSDLGSATTTCAGDKSAPVVSSSNSVTIKVPSNGATSQIGFEVYTQSTPVNNFTAIDPINKTVSSLTPTFSWNSDGVAYQVICIGSYADGHPPGSCNFVNCTADFSPAVHSYVPTTPLLPNTDYRWLVYGQPGNPAPTTGCQSFKTGAAAPECTADSACSVDKKCENNKCVAVICTTQPPVCKKNAVSEHACVLTNVTDGTACTTSSGTAGTCGSGVCNQTCPTGQNSCSGICKNFQTDPANCGSCGKVCASGQACVSAACVNECPAGQKKCGTTCVDPNVNRDNCGECGNACPNSQSCVAAVCKSALTCTDAAFSDTFSADTLDTTKWVKATSTGTNSNPTISIVDGALQQKINAGETSWQYAWTGLKNLVKGDFDVSARLELAAVGGNTAAAELRMVDGDNWSNSIMIYLKRAGGVDVVYAGYIKNDAWHEIDHKELTTIGEFVPVRMSRTGDTVKFYTKNSAGNWAIFAQESGMFDKAGRIVFHTYSGDPYPKITSLHDDFVLACDASSTGEAASCQGDDTGKSGKCYDCNGDGAINMLDFSCFRVRWLEKITN